MDFALISSVACKEVASSSNAISKYTIAEPSLLFQPSWVLAIKTWKYIFLEICLETLQQLSHLWSMQKSFGEGFELAQRVCASRQLLWHPTTFMLWVWSRLPFTVDYDYPGLFTSTVNGKPTWNSGEFVDSGSMIPLSRHGQNLWCLSLAFKTHYQVVVVLVNSLAAPMETGNCMSIWNNHDLKQR